MVEDTRTEGPRWVDSPLVLSVGLVLAISAAVFSFFMNVAPAGMEMDPQKAATYKQVTAVKPVK